MSKTCVLGQDAYTLRCHPICRKAAATHFAHVKLCAPRGSRVRLPSAATWEDISPLSVCPHKSIPHGPFAAAIPAPAALCTPVPRVLLLLIGLKIFYFNYYSEDGRRLSRDVTKFHKHFRGLFCLKVRPKFLFALNFVACWEYLCYTVHGVVRSR